MKPSDPSALKNFAVSKALYLIEKGFVADSIVRKAIRTLLKQRLESLPLARHTQLSKAELDFVAMMDSSPVAPVPEKANEQHYELPPAFFELSLGDRGKYSCCYFSAENEALAEAEVTALALTCKHADLANGMKILELGCGWGSLTLWMAERYPGSTITAVSNSSAQRTFIEAQVLKRGISNIQVLTADMNDFSSQQKFDRIVSVEMFEHMRNYRQFFERISSWLNPNGKFFMHIFCHRSCPYLFEDRGASDWMSKYFFTGGIMPSENLPLYFQDHLKISNRWRWNGQHYEKTCNAWLKRMDKNKALIMPVLANTYGHRNASLWWMRWRLFYMACAELFGYDDGRQWWVAHYLFEKRGQDTA